MTDRVRIVELIYAGVDAFNVQQPDGFRLQKSEETILVGSGGVLDSLGLITLLVALEGNLSEAFGKSITLLDESSLADENGPLKTLGSLADFALSQV